MPVLSQRCQLRSAVRKYIRMEMQSRSEWGVWVPYVHLHPSFSGLEPLGWVILGRFGWESVPTDWV